MNSGGACTPNGSANSNNLNNQSNNNVVIPTSSSNTINSLPPNTNNNNNTNNGLIQSGPQVNGSLQMVCTNPPTSSNGPMLPMSGNPPGIVPGSMSMMNCGPPTPLMSAQPNANILSDRNTPINSASAPNPNHHMQPQNQNIGKAPMDSQYMQQQSQICVFTTTLANEAAEAIQSKRFDSIITYHLSQLSTQKFLEKNPFKGQYRPNSASNWQAMNQQMQINSAMSQSNNNTANNSNKRIKQSASPQQMNAPLSNNNPGNGSSGNNSNSPYTYRPPSNSSVISNNSGNFRPGPSPGTPNDIGNWSTGAGETSGWNSPQQQQQPQQMPGNNFGLMQNPNQRMMPNAPTMTGKLQFFFFF